jgi:hypothetical protein
MLGVATQGSPVRLRVGGRLAYRAPVQCEAALLSQPFSDGTENPI